MSFFLYTYGTLMKNQCRHSILESEQFIQQYSLNGIKLFNYYEEGKKHIIQNYPVALIGDESDISQGEIYLCEDEIQPYLNQMEQVGSLYNIYAFTLEIDSVEQEVLIYVGITKVWERFIGSKYLKPYPNNTLWKPTIN